jgi:hypothetical protein
MSEEDAMERHRPVDADAVEVLAAAANLPLGRERAEAIAERLDGWLVAAGELNEKMARPEHRELLPITVFTHPQTDGGQE